MDATLTVSVWRGAEQGRFIAYEVPLRENQTVLDAVTYIQRYLDHTLTYRFSCRVGVCGSCAMTVNGAPRWTCRTHVRQVAQKNKLEIAPLRNMKIIKDLSVEMTTFFDKWASAKGAFVSTDSEREDFATVRPDSRERRLVDAGIECIGCGVCYAACDLVTWNPEYLGPAALNRAWTLINDVRDGAGTERLAAVAGDAGCHACHSHQSCLEWCPMQLNPTAAIAGLKRATALAALKGKL
ncbi:MAG: succinate dehydrogenase/fumarate reductase iron-sulfur subunit [Acidiferrobacterales bacterium]